MHFTKRSFSVYTKPRATSYLRHLVRTDLFIIQYTVDITGKTVYMLFVFTLCLRITSTSHSFWFKRCENQTIQKSPIAGLMGASKINILISPFFKLTQNPLSMNELDMCCWKLTSKCAYTKRDSRKKSLWNWISEKEFLFNSVLDGRVRRHPKRYKNLSYYLYYYLYRLFAFAICIIICIDSFFAIFIDFFAICIVVQIMNLFCSRFRLLSCP